MLDGLCHDAIYQRSIEEKGREPPQATSSDSISFHGPLTLPPKLGKARKVEVNAAIICSDFQGWEVRLKPPGDHPSFPHAQ